MPDVGTTATDVRGAVAGLLGTVDADRMLRDVERVARHDRYQASDGLRAAAADVAATARAAGLRDVEVHDLPADGEPHWWRWRAPVSWTPVDARLRLTAGPTTLVDLADRPPFALATYATAVDPVEDVPVVDAATSDVRGALVLLPPGAPLTTSVALDLEERGALGALVAPPAPADARGRVELAPGRGLVAFSLTAHEHAAVSRALGTAGGPVRAELAVRLHHEAPSSLVTAVLPGDLADEVWVVAHLCHPQPSANDNASGVAVTLEVARALTASAADRRPRRTVRFLWGPEYLGTVAWLHRQVVAHGARGLPLAVVCVDMVGTDQSAGGGPLVVECAPSGLAGTLEVLAVAAVREAFARTAADPGAWVAAPFLGFSDHALFAGPGVRVPAVQLAHAHDRRTHTSADTVASVSAVELRRTAAACAAVVRAVAGPDGAEADVAGMHRLVDGWLAARQRSAVPDTLPRLAAEHRRLSALVADPPPPAPAGRPDDDLVDGPLNLRECLADLPPALRRDVDAVTVRDKRALAVVHHAVLEPAASAPTPRAAVAHAARALGVTLPTDDLDVLTAVVPALRTGPPVGPSRPLALEGHP